MSQRIFITATGTDIGKTYVTTRLIRELRTAHRTVHALKPVVSGYTEGEDNDITAILDAAYDNLKPSDICLYRLKAPLSPDMAARAEGVTLDYDAILQFCQRDHAGDFMLIEGVGGVMTPLTETHLVLDLIADLGCGALLVAGTYLGTISHTLTALHALSSRDVPVRAVILSASPGDGHPPLEDTIATLKNFTDAPIITLPRGEAPELSLAQALGLITL
jgi:dethiobiotin synthetase